MHEARVGTGDIGLGARGGGVGTRPQYLIVCLWRCGGGDSMKPWYFVVCCWRCQWASCHCHHWLQWSQRSFWLCQQNRRTFPVSHLNDRSSQRGAFAPATGGLPDHPPPPPVDTHIPGSLCHHATWFHMHPQWAFVFVVVLHKCVCCLCCLWMGLLPTGLFAHGGYVSPAGRWGQVWGRQELLCLIATSDGTPCTLVSQVGRWKGSGPACSARRRTQTSKTRP